MNSDRDVGQQLRQQRESVGLTLQAIAASTKIQASLLAAVERNDLSRLPPGIFRRALLRQYAAAVGLPAESLLAEFGRVFPEDNPHADPGLRSQTYGPDEGLRLTLVLDDGWRVGSVLRQLSVAVLDCGAVLLLATLVAFLTNMTMWLSFGLMGSAYWTLGTVCVGRSFGAWWLNRSAFRTFRTWRRAAAPEGHAPDGRALLAAIVGQPGEPAAIVSAAERAAPPHPSR